MSNETPPCAVLGDFGFITIALIPGRELSFSVEEDLGTPAFMAPELFHPGSTPTLQSDVYAFGMVIFEVRGQDYDHRLVSTVLTYTFFRSLRVNYHSTILYGRMFTRVLHVELLNSTWRAVGAQANLRTPHASDFLIGCGVSLSGAGTRTLRRDQRSRTSWSALKKQRQPGQGSCHP